VETQVCGDAWVLHDVVVTSLGTSEPPAAVRASRPTWRDPRLWVGILILAASVVAGARLLGQADDSVSVWAAREDLAPGESVGADDLVAHRVRFADAGNQDRYLLVEDPLPEPATLARAMGAGELVPRSALGQPDGTGLLTVPISLPSLSVPPDLTVGAHVDVWVTVDTRRGAVARPFLSDVVVIALPSATDAYGVSGERQLVLGVDQAQSQELGHTLAAVGDSAITVVGRG
jgi:hypothetical protein